MSKHTPGPWAAIPDSGADSEGDWYVLTEDEDTMSLGVSEADARLIAAAPDLLAALTVIRDAFWSDGETDAERVVDLKEIARAAIAKAEGTS